MPYDFTPFQNLNQLDGDVFLDIIGLVKEIHMQADQDKKKIILVNDAYEKDVFLQGSHAHLDVKVGDVLALKSARISKWKHYRNVMTGCLTFIDFASSTLPIYSDMCLETWVFQDFQ